jgi:hypothetical protein
MVLFIYMYFLRNARKKKKKKGAVGEKGRKGKRHIHTLSHAHRLEADVNKRGEKKKE